MKILAGDIGGTHTRLGIFAENNGRQTCLAEKIYPSRDYPGLAAIATAFAAEHRLPVEGACFAIAGPVRDGRANPPNLPWQVDAAELKAALKIAQVRLINDLEANAWGVAALEAADLAVLNTGVPAADGNAAVISAGTGLGEAGMFWDGSGLRPYACEGGHVDFAPRDDIEIELLRYLRGRFERVSYERVLSGPGLCNIYRFLRDTGKDKESAPIATAMAHEDPAAVIAQAALDGSCGLCLHALELFVSIYGAEAGNLALKTMATQGIYLGGGIAPKIIEKLKTPAFLAAFSAKGRMRPLLEAIPISVILNQATALLGAARYAAVADPRS